MAGHYLCKQTRLDIALRWNIWDAPETGSKALRVLGLYLRQTCTASSGTAIQLISVIIICTGCALLVISYFCLICYSHIPRRFRHGNSRAERGAARQYSKSIYEPIIPQQNYIFS